MLAMLRHLYGVSRLLNCANLRMNFLEQIITAEVKWRLDRLAVEDYFDAQFPNTFAFEIHGFQDFLQEIGNGK